MTAVNDAPEVTYDDEELAPGQAEALFDVLADDNPGGGADEAGQSLTLASISNPPGRGTATIEGDSIRYVPDAGFGGNDSLQYRVCDDGTTDAAPDPRCTQASVFIRVHSIPPVAVDDAAAGDEDTTFEFNVLANDTDADHHELSAFLTATNLRTQHGVVRCSSDGDCAYTPDADYHGADGFDYTVRDTTNESDGGRVALTVLPVNDAPRPGEDRLATTKGVPATVSVLGDDVDVEGDAMTVTGAQDGQHGTASCTAAGVCRYTPEAGFTGPDRFRYTVGDGEDTAQGTVRVVVLRAPQPADVPDSKGREFWLAFGENLGTPDLSLYLTGDRSTEGTVTSPAVALDAPFTVTQGDVTTVGVPRAAALPAPQQGAILEGAGVRVSATDEVTAYGLNHVDTSTDAFLGLPTDVLGTEHLILSWRSGGLSWHGGQLRVVGVEDGTAITVTRPGGAPLHSQLDEGDVYTLGTSAVAGNDLSGTEVTSSRPVAVFAGMMCANITAELGACDHIVEQIPPISTWGRSFVTVPLATRTKGDRVRILAAEDGTVVRIDGAQVATLDRGELHEQVLEDAAAITATGPVLVAQFAHSFAWDFCANSACDPFMMLIPPYEQFLGSYTFTTPATGYRDNYVNVVAPAAAVDGVRLDGRPWRSRASARSQGRISRARSSRSTSGRTCSREPRRSARSSMAGTSSTPTATPAGCRWGRWRTRRRSRCRRRRSA